MRTRRLRAMYKCHLYEVPQYTPSTHWELVKKQLSHGRRIHQHFESLRSQKPPCKANKKRGRR